MNRFLVRAVPMAVALSLFANAANSQDVPDPERPCQEYNLTFGGSVGVGATGADGTLHGGVDVLGDAAILIETTLGAVGDLLCKLFPCAGTGGTGGGGDDGPTEDPGPDDGGNPEDPPEDEPGDGDDGESTNTDESSVRTCTSNDEISFEELVSGIKVVRQGLRDDVFVTEFASDSAVHPRVFAFNRPFRLPEEIKSANELSGDWFVPRGRYMVDEDNRVRIPVQLR